MFKLVGPWSSYQLRSTQDRNHTHYFSREIFNIKGNVKNLQLGRKLLTSHWQVRGRDKAELAGTRRKDREEVLRKGHITLNRRLWCHRLRRCYGTDPTSRKKLETGFGWCHRRELLLLEQRNVAQFPLMSWRSSRGRLPPQPGSFSVLHSQEPGDKLGSRGVGVDWELESQKACAMCPSCLWLSTLLFQWS